MLFLQSLCHPRHIFVEKEENGEKKLLLKLLDATHINIPSSLYFKFNHDFDDLGYSLPLDGESSVEAVESRFVARFTIVCAV